MKKTFNIPSVKLIRMEAGVSVIATSTPYQGSVDTYGSGGNGTYSPKPALAPGRAGAPRME